MTKYSAISAKYTYFYFLGWFTMSKFQSRVQHHAQI